MGPNATRDVPSCACCGFAAECHGFYESGPAYSCDDCCDHEDGCMPFDPDAPPSAF